MGSTAFHADFFRALSLRALAARVAMLRQARIT
jgi:hypothetical protein